jgi:hypothetical protein
MGEMCGKERGKVEKKKRIEILGEEKQNCEWRKGRGESREICG